MAGSTSQRSPWAFRLGIVGALLLIGAGIALSSQSDAIDAIYDPRQRAAVELDMGGSENVEVVNGECYMAVVLSGASDSEVEAKKVIGSAAANEVLKTSNCFTDWTPMASDGASFTVLEEWAINETGELRFSATCTSDDCEDDVVWIVNVDDWQMEIFDYSGLMIGFGLCCIGLILVPVAAIIAYSNRSKAVRSTLSVIGRDDDFLRSLQEQDQAMVAQHPMLQRLQNELEQQNATREESPAEEEGFVDGSKAVMQGQLLTTEQVYAFMRGDVEEMSRPVEDPFADAVTPKKQPRTEVKKANTEQISVWDMGGDAGTATKATTPTRKQSSQPETKTDSKDWAEWDEM